MKPWRISFSGKLIIAFTFVSLAPLILMMYLNDRATRDILETRAEQSLTAAATETAHQLDQFLTQNRKLIELEAQYLTFVNFLRTANVNPNSIPADITQNMLNNLQRKNTAFITSYAVLDRTGRNRLDSDPENVGRDESQEDYFVDAIRTGLTQISAVRFTSDAQLLETRNLQFCFSHPIRLPQQNEPQGVLRMCYKASILQQLIVRNNGLTGPGSFGVLFDEQNVHLAHGLRPDLIFKTASPLSASEIEQLQQDRRLPNLPDQQLTINLPELTNWLRNAQFESLFTINLDPSTDDAYLAAVEPLEEVQWVVIFAQPRSIFEAPVNVHIQQMIWVTLGVSGVVFFIAFLFGARFASRIRQLTEAVIAFSEGNMEARAALRSNDEVETLARKFNQMAEQVGSLLQSLASRTAQLEAEIDKRQQVQSALQTSETKYRRIYEDAKDAIIITNEAGRILDANPAVVSTLGYTPTEMRQMNIKGIYADIHTRQKVLAEIDRDGFVRDYEIQFRRKDGSIADILLTSSVLSNDLEDEELLFLGIFSDVTAKKQAERERMRLMQMRQELNLAQSIQRNLLPFRNPNLSNLDLACYTRSARQVGGDFYTYHQIPDQRDWYGFAVGDVSGKGMPAALLMAVSLASFQAIRTERFTPATLLQRMDKVVTNYTQRGNQNCATVYAQLLRHSDGESATLTIANAGGIAPIIKEADGTVRWVEVGGLPLGTGLDATYTPTTLIVHRGDTIMFSSDGLVEAFDDNGEMFGFERLETLVREAPNASAQIIVDHIKQNIFSFSNKLDLHDDLTVLVVNV